MRTPLPALLVLSAAAAATTTSAAPRPPAALASRPETAAAREQARLCERLSGEEGTAACRLALAQGIGPSRWSAVRELLARHLVALEKWDELADLFREAVGLDPQDPVGWQRLGTTLLFALDQPAEAIGALREAVRLAPGDAGTRATLGIALVSTGRADEGRAAIEEALRLDPAILDGRPAARAVLEAARTGTPWP